ncbi:hypothetical protein AALO_G00064420 [Alosa alosa]|uniref:Uncharacterized protein n=1 Tax=Alosa alosa TaxID=278164 RepID=A0AAV6H0D4_9TELE|nr:hypothetical protein AALO_G00064420 [Alosa alosa]
MSADINSGITCPHDCVPEACCHTHAVQIQNQKLCREVLLCKSIVTKRHLLVGSAGQCQRSLNAHTLAHQPLHTSRSQNQPVLAHWGQTLGSSGLLRNVHFSCFT